MSDEGKVSARATRRTCGRYLLFLILGLPLLTILLFLFLSTSLGLRFVVAPVAELLLDVSISFRNASVSPMLTRIDLERVDVSWGGDFFLSVASLHARWQPWSLWHRIVRIEALEAQGLHLRYVSDGESGEDNPPEETDEEGHGPSFFLVARNTVVSDADVALEWKQDPSGPPTAVSLKGIRVSLPKWISGEAGEFSFSAPAALVSGHDFNVSSGRVEGRITAIPGPGFDVDRFELEVLAQVVAGSIAEATMKERELALRIAANREGSSYRVDELRLDGKCGDEVEADLSVQGSVSLDPPALDVQIGLERLSGPLLRLVWELLGYGHLDWTGVRYSGSLSFSGETLKTRGTLSAQGNGLLSQSAKKPVSMPLSLNVRHDMILDLSNKEAEILALKGDLEEAGRGVVEVTLANTAHFSWKPGAKRFFHTLPRLDLTVRRLRLDTVKPLFPAGSKVGVFRGLMNGTFTTALDGTGHVLQISGRSSVSGFTIKSPGFSAENIDVKQSIDCRVQDFSRLLIRSLTVQARQREQPLVDARIAGEIALGGWSGSLRIDLGPIHSSVFSFFPEIAGGSQTAMDAIRQLREFGFSCSTNAEYDLQRKRVSLANLKGGLTREKKEAVSISFDGPLVLSWAQKTGGPLLLDPVVAKIVVADETATLANPLLSSNLGIGIQAGTMRAGIAVAIKRDVAGYEFRFSTQDPLCLRDLVLSGKNGAVTTSPIQIESRFDVFKSPESLDVTGISVAMLQDGRQTADLRLSGSMGLVSGEEDGADGRTPVLKVLSTGIDWKPLLSLLSQSGDPSREQGPGATHEKASMCTDVSDLKGMDALVVVDLKNMNWGEQIRTDWETRLRISESSVTADPLNLSVNGTPFLCSVEVDTGRPCGMPFKIHATTGNLDLASILIALSGKQSSTAKGQLKTLSVDADGTGVTRTELETGLEGVVEAEITDLVVPSDLKAKPLIRLVYLPFDVLSATFVTLRDPSAFVSETTAGVMAPHKKLVELLSKTFRKGSADTGKQSELRFREATLMLEAQKGRMYLRKCVFRGEQGGNDLSFKGWIGLDGTLSLLAEFKISTVGEGLILPLKIGGTLDKPVPDVATFLLKFMQKNALNLIDPTSWARGVENTVGTVGRILMLPERIVKGLIEGIRKGTGQNAEDETKAK